MRYGCLKMAHGYLKQITLTGWWSDRNSLWDFIWDHTRALSNLNCQCRSFAGIKQIHADHSKAKCVIMFQQLTRTTDGTWLWALQPHSHVSLVVIVVGSLWIIKVIITATALVLKCWHGHRHCASSAGGDLRGGELIKQRLTDAG